jgi:hypothetical protein
MTAPGMSCERTAELLSDHREGLLEGPLAADVVAHLAGCEACRALDGSLAEVLDLLRAAPEIEPAADLAERAASAALRAGRGRHLRLVRGAAELRATLAARAAGWGVPPRVQAVAAVLAIALSAGLVLVGAAGAPVSAGAGPRRPALTDRVSRAAVYVTVKRDQLVEDFRLLRVVIATAFEGRLDRVNDRVEDYRRLLERRRQDGARDNKKSQASLDASGWALAVLPSRVPWTLDI